MFQFAQMAIFAIAAVLIAFSVFVISLFLDLRWFS
jgi:hypothetical protein